MEKSLAGKIRQSLCKISIKDVIILCIAVILLVSGITAFADGLQDLTQLVKLFGEAGVTTFHLDDFNFSGIDFDMLIRIIGNSKINFSMLDYDAFLDLFKSPEFLAELGIEGVDEDALLVWLKDPATGDKINEMMLNVRNGGSFSACMDSFVEDSLFQESFSVITNGEDFLNVMNSLTSEKASRILNEMAAALLSPQNGPRSEAAIILSIIVQNASDTLGWK